jgi:DNA (cytosine-5)-methyltransferase 1
MIAVDLFCGAGGLTRGLRNAGISVILGIDNNETCSLSYEYNNRPTEFLCSDLRNVAAEDIRRRLVGRMGVPLLVAGCAPCQPFSTHQRSSRSEDDSRLLREVARMTAELQPEWVFIENVPGIARVRGFSTYSRFKSALAGQGYAFAEGTVDAKWYGVPQNRRRLVLIASRVAKPSLPDPTHGDGKERYRTVRDAISHFPGLAAGERHPMVPNHGAADITEINLRRLRLTPSDGGGRMDWPVSLALNCHKERHGHEDVYGRMRWDAPAPTLTCRCFSISNGRYGHPDQDRAISLREAATLQSFPEDYQFFGPTQQSIGAQIGNAVPVGLAEAIGRHILSLSDSVPKTSTMRRKPKGVTWRTSTRLRSDR